MTLEDLNAQLRFKAAQMRKLAVCLMQTAEDVDLALERDDPDAAAEAAIQGGFRAVEIQAEQPPTGRTH